MTEKGRHIYFFAMFALVFYLLGASFVESFVNYPTWRAIGANEFEGYYHELASRIIKVMVLPGLLEILLTVALFWLRPRVIPRWSVALALSLNLGRFVLMALSQTRFQEQIGANGFSRQSIDGLIQMDYLAQAASVARALLYVWMASLVIENEGRRGAVA